METGAGLNRWVIYDKLLKDLIIKNFYMSNRTLVIVIILIILAGVAAGYYLYRKDTAPLVMDTNSITPPATPENSEQKASPTEQQAQNSDPSLSGQCQRNFDEAKLKSNSNLSLAGRQVEMDVKDFGKIVLEFYEKDAPKTVENFLRLTDAGYYNCLTFHRVAKGFVIQGGDPSGNGSGGVSVFGKSFEDELNANTASYKAGYVKGVLAMANSGPNTNGSQFFIMLADNPLPHAYTIFGKVRAGLDVVDKIGQVEITPQMGPTDGAPTRPVVMESVKIIK